MAGPAKHRSAVVRTASDGAAAVHHFVLTALEPRENPAIPGGLLDVPYILPASTEYAPPGYAETHALTRTETNTITVDQSGTGSAGTFTIDVVGSTQTGDTASGSGANDDTSVTATGTGSDQLSYHLVISGDYAGEVFTVTSLTYTGTGSYTTSQDTIWVSTYENEDGSFSTSTYEWDTTRSGSYTLSYSAALDGNGQLVYTSYSFSATDSAYWHIYSTASGGWYTESTYDAYSSVNTTGSGDTADYSGSNSWHEAHEVHYPNYDDSWQSGRTNPVSGTGSLGLPYGWTEYLSWQAGSYDVINFTFHGEASETTSLTQSATYRVNESYGVEFDVD